MEKTQTVNQNDVQDALKEIVQDFVTNETALLVKNRDDPNSCNMLYYSRTELGGDAIQISTDCSPEILELAQALKTSNIKNRKAVWNFLTKALT